MADSSKLVRIHGPQHRKYIKFRDGLGLRDPQEDQTSMMSGPKIEKIWEVSQVIFGGNVALEKSSKNNFPVVWVINFRSLSSFFFEKWLPENHENTTFQTFLEPWGPRDRPWIQERKILFRIALTRALYDQMAPQLCRFYISATVDFFVPRQPTIFCVNLATREMITITTNVSGGRSRRGKSFLYYSALTNAGTKKRRPKT